MIHAILDNVEIILSLMLLLCTIVILFSNEFLVIIPLMSIFSLITACIYLLLDAPDVAITESSVGACVSTILLLLGYSKLKHKTIKTSKIAFLPFILVGIIFIFLVYLIYDLPEFGQISAPIHHHIADYYIKNTGNEIGIYSVVASILASYRGYDTFGETIVIFTAGISVLLLLKKKEQLNDN
jgi:multicomponent Na+:H+ antiporter subunit B